MAKDGTPLGAVDPVKPEWSAADIADLIVALDMKITSLARAKNSKSAEKEFAVTYEAAITRYEALKARVKAL